MHRVALSEVPYCLEREPNGISGACSVLWKYLSARLNISLVYHGIMDFGIVYPNGSGTGAIGTVLRNETDLCLTPVFLTKEAVDYLDYTTTVFSDDWAFVSGPPRNFSKNYFSTLESFEKPLWVVLFVVLLLYCIIWAIINNMLNRTRDCRSFLKKFANCVFVSTMALLNQQHSFNCQRNFDRIYGISWRIPALCLSLSFTGLLLAKLALKDEPLRYETVNDILTDKNIKIFILDESPPHDDMKASLDKEKYGLWERARNDGTIKLFHDVPLLDYVEEMNEGRMVMTMLRAGFLASASSMCGVIPDCYCSNQAYMTTNYALFMNKNLDLNTKKLLKFTASQVDETRLIQIKLDTLMSLGQMCLSSTEPEKVLDEPLTADKFYFVALFYLIFFSLSVIAMCVEFYMYQRK